MAVYALSAPIRCRSGTTCFIGPALSPVDTSIATDIIVVIMASRSALKIITALALRKESGKLLDQVDYRKERFVVQRAGKPKAVLIPLQDYEQLERQKLASQDRFWTVISALQQRIAQHEQREVQAAIHEAVTQVRQATGSASAR